MVAWVRRLASAVGACLLVLFAPSSAWALSPAVAISPTGPSAYVVLGSALVGGLFLGSVILAVLLSIPSRL